MTKVFICLLGLVLIDLAVCNAWYNHWHHPHGHETATGDEKTDLKFDKAFDKHESRGDDDDDDLDNFFVHEHHHYHHWHNHPDDISHENVSGRKYEAKCLDKSNSNAEERKIFFGCMVSKLIEQCIKNCHVTNDFDSLCGTEKCAASCGIDPSIILSKVCPQANVITPTISPTTAAPVNSKPTPSVVIAVDGTSFINIDKGSDINSNNKTNSTKPFKTPIFTKDIALPYDEEPNAPLYFKDPSRPVSTNKRI